MSHAKLPTTALRVTEKIARLQRVAEHLGATGDTDDARVAEALRAFLRGEDFTAALGLAPGYATVHRARRLEDALGELIAIFPACSRRALAQKLSVDLGRPITGQDRCSGPLLSVKKAQPGRLGQSRTGVSMKRGIGGSQSPGIALKTGPEVCRRGREIRVPEIF